MLGKIVCNTRPGSAVCDTRPGPTAGYSVFGFTGRDTRPGAIAGYAVPDSSDKASQQVKDSF